MIEHPNVEKELNKFYIQEANFYINKALNSIGAMQINVKGIFSDEPKDIVQNKKIDVQRLKVVIENLQRLRENGNTILAQLGDEEFERQQNEINKQYDQRIEQFIHVYNKIDFKIPIEWKTDQSDK